MHTMFPGKWIDFTFAIMDEQANVANSVPIILLPGSRVP